MAASANVDHSDFVNKMRGNFKINSRPRSLLLRRTSSCSSLPLNKRKQEPDWECNEGGAPSVVLNDRAPPLIMLQPLREGVEHFSELVTPDPPCHFCRESTSKPVHEDCTRLKIVSRGKLKSFASPPPFVDD